MPPRDRDLRIVDRIDEFLQEHGERPELLAVGLIVRDFHGLLSDTISTNRAVAGALTKLAEQNESFNRRFEKHEEVEIKQKQEMTKDFVERIGEVQDQFLSAMKVQNEAAAEERGRQQERERSKAVEEKRTRQFMWAFGVAVAAIQAMGGFIISSYTTTIQDLAAAEHRHDVEIATLNAAKNGAPPP